jgi:hypothetical protein
MGLWMSRCAVAGGLCLSFLLGIAMATLVGRGMTSPVRAGAVTCPLTGGLPSSMNGMWFSGGDTNKPAQVSSVARMDLANEFGSTASAHLACDGAVMRIIVDQGLNPGRSGNSWQAGLGGTVLNPNGDGLNWSLIKWDNGTTWSR